MKSNASKHPEDPRLELVRGLLLDKKYSEKEYREAEWRMWRLIQITRQIYLDTCRKHRESREEDQAAGVPSEYDLTWNERDERWVLTYTRENLFIGAFTTNRAALKDGALLEKIGGPGRVRVYGKKGHCRAREVEFSAGRNTGTIENGSG